MNTQYYGNKLKLSLALATMALPLITQAGQHPRYKLVDLGTLSRPSVAYLVVAGALSIGAGAALIFVLMAGVHAFSAIGFGLMFACRGLVRGTGREVCS